ncbi:pectinesterase family protein [Hymenobacter edaphi]|uniref:Pectinesterase n=1 Tax=Hymenobacter edaphi TaxID=2211146 RepID=A0A328BGW7_9BACT|nr:pectinesterase family protein [Hymenobacter edaphi]RAK65124.1 pectin esterase [Hymenobacter edaphi]
MKHLLLLICLGWLTLGRACAYDFVVAQDGSGQFRSVQEAFNAVPDFRKKVTTIFVKKGTYKEKLVLAGSKNLVRLIGEDRDQTILTYDDYNQKKNIFGEDKGTSGSASGYLYGTDFTAENLTFQNSSGPVGQAVALWVAGDRMRFKNCRFLGFQDTLYTYGYGSRQYYQDCYIEGTVDFIFGSSTAWFEGCTLFCKKNGYVTAASTPDSVRYGYVFNNCRVTGDAPAGTFLLGRPWRPHAKTVFLRCELGPQIGAAGWDHWDKDTNKQTARYAEYQNRGPGAQPARRVLWSRQLSDEEARQYTVERVFRNWNPKLDL